MNNNRKLSMSIMLENRKISTDISIPKTSPSIWIPSKNISKCFKCKSSFSIINRKHHCRMCGRIFCSNCADEWGVIPSLINITSPPEKSFSMYSLLYSEKRMCKSCNIRRKFITDSSKNINVLTLLPITFKELYGVRLVNKEWCKSVNTILSFYKGVQYKLPCIPFTKLEKKLLWNHRYEFSQHFLLISKCLSSFDNGEIIQLEKIVRFYNKRIPYFRCRELACRRNCEARPKMEELLEICNNKYIINNKLCRYWLHVNFKFLSNNELKIITPWLINCGLKYNSMFYDIIIPLYSKEISLIYSFFFECKFLMKDKIIFYSLNKVLDIFLSKIDDVVKIELNKTLDFIEFINENIFLNLSKIKWEKQVNNWIKNYGPVNLPWDNNIQCIGIVAEGIHVYNSATKPWKIPLIVKTKNGEKILDILVKFEDVRKDKLTMVVSRFLNIVCKGIIDIKTYNVFPVNDTCGWIEMVEKSSTLYDIKHKYDTTLQDYILDLNPQLTIQDMRNNFISTCASSCVLCYVMGVGDRHLENILVTKDGKLLHIDFSYVLGDDPKNLKVEMKITQDMVNMLGGPDSKYFKFFKESCTSAYKKIRLRSSLWYILLSYLEFSTPSIDSFKYDKVTIKNHIIERLLPGENDKEASMQIVDIVNRSSKSSWTQNLAEFSHKIGNTLREVTQFNMEL